MKPNLNGEYRAASNQFNINFSIDFAENAAVYENLIKAATENHIDLSKSGL